MKGSCNLAKRIRQSGLKVVIDFTKDILDRTRDFTGREWVFKVINDWLANLDSSRFFLLTGEPGSGKTAIASQLCQFSLGEVLPPDSLIYLQKGFLCTIHFCSARDRRWINPQVFAESLALQLSELYPAYAKALDEMRGDRKIDIKVEQQIGTAEQVVGVIIKSIDLSGISPEDAFIRIVREPLEALYRENSAKQIVILVDALDEALLYSGEVSIVSLLAQAEKLPNGVRFILTSRRDERVENQFMGAEGLFLSESEFNKYNNDDIANYVKRRLSHDKELALKLAELKPNQVAELVETITNKAAGNFQHISFLLDAIARGQQQLNELEKLPAGLDAAYYESLGRVIKLSNNDWSKDYSPLIGVLSVAQESMTQAQLQAFTRQSESMIWAHLGHLQQFFEEVNIKEKQTEEPGYRLYHQSFVDFFHRQSLIVENKRLRNSYYIPADEWHKRIVEYYRANANSWDKVNWKRVDDYGLRHLSTHLSMLKNEKAYRQELYGLICKSFIREKQRRFGSHQSLAIATDVKLAIEAARSEKPPNLMHLALFLEVLFANWEKLRNRYEYGYPVGDLQIALNTCHYRGVRTALKALFYMESDVIGLVKDDLEFVKNNMSIEDRIISFQDALKSFHQSPYITNPHFNDILESKIRAISEKIFKPELLVPSLGKIVDVLVSWQLQSDTTQNPFKVSSVDAAATAIRNLIATDYCNNPIINNMARDRFELEIVNCNWDWEYKVHFISYQWTHIKSCKRKFSELTPQAQQLIVEGIKKHSDPRVRLDCLRLYDKDKYIFVNEIITDIDRQLNNCSDEREERRLKEIRNVAKKIIS